MVEATEDIDYTLTLNTKENEEVIIGYCRRHACHRRKLMQQTEEVPVHLESWWHYC